MWKLYFRLQYSNTNNVTDFHELYTSTSLVRASDSEVPAVTRNRIVED